MKIYEILYTVGIRIYYDGVLMVLEWYGSDDIFIALLVNKVIQIIIRKSMDLKPFECHHIIRLDNTIKLYYIGQ